MIEPEIHLERIGLGKILSVSWQKFVKHINTITFIILIVYLPINILAQFIPLDHFINEYGTSGFRYYQNIIRFLNSIFGVIGIMAIAYIVEGSFIGKEYNYKLALKKSISRWGSVLGTSILGGLIILGLTLLLIIPGIIWSVYYTFVVFVVALRDLGGKSALDYSKSLVEGQWWWVVGINFAVGVMGFIIGIVLGLLFTLIPELFLVEIVTDTIFDLIGAFFIVSTTVFFLNVDYLKNNNNIEITPILQRGA